MLTMKKKSNFNLQSESKYRNAFHFFKWTVIVLSFSTMGFSNLAGASTPPVIAGEYIVKMRSSFNSLKKDFFIQSLSTLNINSVNSLLTATQVPASTEALFLETLNQAYKGEVESLDPSSPYLKITRDPTEAPAQVVKELLQSPDIELAEPNRMLELFQTPNDEQYATQWGLHNTGQGNEWGVPGLEGVDINVEKAWDITTGSKNVVVAVIDSGINYNHADLKENIWTNPAELNGKPSVDDDNNGYVDDIYGYDFFNNDADPMDDNGHGTHAAGIIGASGNNKMGVSGVNWNVKLMPIKFSNEKIKGSVEGGIKAIQYAVKMGAQIINASWGGEDSSKVLADAIREAGNKNVLFVAAAGNSARDNDSKATKPIYPASFDIPTIISVAAINQKAELSYFSCYGAKSVHLAAPGENIWSTWMDGGYKKNSGTSVAAPFVSGVAALLLSHEPQLTALQIKERLIKTAYPLRSFQGKALSNGRVDAGSALLNQTNALDANDPQNWTIMDSKISSDHPYNEGEKRSWEINIPGAKAISVYFEKFIMETQYDMVDIHDRKGLLIARLNGANVHGWSRIIVGDYVKIVLTSDLAVQNYGFDISKVAYH